MKQIKNEYERPNLALVIWVCIMF